jgi:hypothetical protein
MNHSMDLIIRHQAASCLRFFYSNSVMLYFGLAQSVPNPSGDTIAFMICALVGGLLVTT